MRVAAYVYPGWHPIPERDQSFHPGFTEWELVYGCRPRFDGHAQPRLPAWGRYDDRDSSEVGRRVTLAAEHGVDAFVYGFFWCRGKRVFQSALDEGFLQSPEGRSFPFAVMWANRMPRRVLPVARADVAVIDPERLVPSDVEDFVTLIQYLGERYFARENYLRVDGRPYFSIFDSSFFVRELGLDGAAEAIRRARAWLHKSGIGDFFLAAIEPASDHLPRVRELGFDCVTNYVLLPEWKGDFQQDYATAAARRADEWSRFARVSGLPYFPSVSPGWDASPRGADFGPERPRKYPWWPVVVGEHPDKFRAALGRAFDFGAPLTMVASWNEWSEGHYLEPDERYGLDWLKACQVARKI
jgi:Glycosyltransferase WbsX